MVHAFAGSAQSTKSSHHLQIAQGKVYLLTSGLDLKATRILVHVVKRLTEHSFVVIYIAYLPKQVMQKCIRIWSILPHGRLFLDDKNIII